MKRYFEWNYDFFGLNIGGNFRDNVRTQLVKI